MKHKYRIVTDRYCGYEAQYKPWWSPFWLECFGVNTRRTIEASEQVARFHAEGLTREGEPKKAKCVKVLGKLP
ncbi:hypothetical protein GobsT_50020 [Gemmata obscuriglobus]|uniref:Uncharacterized protein n=1 Tax=Gemmata obscuriglobus TaxID=114 RepID=A0A2Z3GWU3_9BACT|nr:hypothetical protein C1280_08620 [Gemmata obscuriglobus]QEG30199.1 hypothetical protein GobsT_50020 [Gemmata obscuriglobus]VTS09523.1 Uncharacterized protein OS=Pseudomonas aeruginosa GN=D480_18410 PE=4 SV=1 [Gemmata obscuriglobus UQM 2246]